MYLVYSHNLGSVSVSVNYSSGLSEQIILIQMFSCKAGTLVWDSSGIWLHYLQYLSVQEQILLNNYVNLDKHESAIDVSALYKRDQFVPVERVCLP